MSANIRALTITGAVIAAHLHHLRRLRCARSRHGDYARRLHRSHESHERRQKRHHGRCSDWRSIFYGVRRFCVCLVRLAL